MNTTVTDNARESRYEIRFDGARAGFAEYHLHAGVVAFIHTEISPEFGRRGLASELIRAALDSARTRGLQVQPFCPFVRGFIAKHPDYRDLVPSAERERFGLG
jgi:predicted GNAT family acetyltransferase